MPYLPVVFVYLLILLYRHTIYYEFVFLVLDQAQQMQER